MKDLPVLGGIQHVWEGSEGRVGSQSVPLTQRPGRAAQPCEGSWGSGRALGLPET